MYKPIYKNLRVLPPETLIERHIGRRRVHLKKKERDSLY